MERYLYSLATDRSRGFIAAIIKFFLFLASAIYGLVIRALIFLYRLSPCRLGCKVISVGNITLGGTGKTSLVKVIAGYLQQRGHKVAILTRGYKRKKITNYELRITNYENMGDEPYMLQMSLADIPVIVDSNRVRSANRAISEYGTDTVIFDDGLQQWRIKKDLEIVTIDATNPFGNLHMIPRGILREPLSCLKRADVFVLTKTNLNADLESIKDILNKLNPSGLIIESIHQPQGFYNIHDLEELSDTESLKGKTVALFSGIGDPDSFENLITGLGIQVGLSFRFADHHNYTREDLDKIIKSSRDKNIDTVITTQKDAARLCESGVSPRLRSGEQASYGLRILVLRIELLIKDEQGFYNRLLKLYSL